MDNFFAEIMHNIGRNLASTIKRQEIIADASRVETKFATLTRNQIVNSSIILCYGPWRCLRDPVNFRQVYVLLMTDSTHIKSRIALAETSHH